MVMEATPTPQSVGREFVRQYYTLLNKSPTHLHRFYNHQSSFVHGGLGDPEREIIPAVGQKQIHQKIKQLNFRDCHAKISQVDSQATLDGVVIQVTGELSSAGQPMRRFTQTFVLVAQAPKAYYVHNDIFRYQDFGFPDEEEGELEAVESGLGDGGEREGDEGRGSEPEEDEQQAQQHSTSATSADQQSHGPLISTQQQPLQQQQPLFYAPPPQQPVHTMMQPVINGSVHEETQLINQQQAPQGQQQHPYIKSETAEQEQFNEEQELDTPVEQQQTAEDESQGQTEESQEQTEPENFASSGRETEAEQTSAANANSNKPMTYANLVSASFSCPLPPTSSQPPKMSVSPPPSMTNLRVSDDRSIVHPASSGPALSSSSNISPRQLPGSRVRSIQAQPQQQPQPQQQQQPRPLRGGPAPRDGDRRSSRLGQYPDDHQLFLGNLPHEATTDELRTIFVRYGKVVDLRIHSKSLGGKGPQSQNSLTRVPNYGFITFEDVQTVFKVLEAGPICYPDENGQKLNIEEKKVKLRLPMEGGSSRPSLNDGNMRPPGGQQQQQQQQHQQQRGPAYSSGYPGGPGGPMRGGQHGSRGGRGGFSRSGDGGRGGGGMRQPANSSYQNRSR